VRSFDDADDAAVLVDGNRVKAKAAHLLFDTL
jgi:hypothetical protein